MRAPLTSEIDAAKDALSRDPVPADAAAITSILPAKEDESVVEVVLTVVIEAAKDALFAFIALDRLFIDTAEDALFVVIVPFILVIDELNEDDAE